MGVDASGRGTPFSSHKPLELQEGNLGVLSAQIRDLTLFLRLLLWIPLLPFSRGSPEDLPSQRAAPVLSNPIPSLLCPLFPLFLQSALWFGLPCTNPQPLSAVRACGTLRGWYSQANPSILVPRKQPSLEATSKCPFSCTVVDTVVI